MFSIPRHFLIVSSIGLLCACSEAPEPTFMTGSCAVDVPKVNDSHKASLDAHIVGWAFDQATGTVPEKVLIQVASTDRKIVEFFEAQRGTIPRSDLAKYLNVPVAEFSSFDALIPGDSLAKGAYSLAVVQKLNRGFLVCNSATVLQIN